MNIPWNHSQCILCLCDTELTVEHVIPASLGGKLTCRFLCKQCNSSIGSQVEGLAKHDPAIHLEIERLPSSHSKIKSALAEGLEYVTVGSGPATRGHIKDGDFKARSERLPDGSLIQDEAQAKTTLRTMLSRDGLSAARVESALEKLNSTPLNTLVEIVPGVRVVTWKTEAIQPALSGPSLNPLVPAKSAFEFLALHLGSSVYDSDPPLQAIRTCLLSNQIDPAYVTVERLQAENSNYFHGLYFEGNSPHAIVQVRYFGRLAAKVHFKKLAIEGRRHIYTHDLTTGAEGIAETNDSAAQYGSNK